MSMTVAPCRNKSEAEVRYRPHPPGEFKEGDIVEGAVSFIAYPLPKTGEGPQYKLVATLRALNLLSSEYREVGTTIQRHTSRTNGDTQRAKPVRKTYEDKHRGRKSDEAVPHARTLKRKLLVYEEDDEFCGAEGVMDVTKG